MKARTGHFHDNSTRKGLSYDDKNHLVNTDCNQKNIEYKIRITGSNRISMDWVI